MFEGVGGRRGPVGDARFVKYVADVTRHRFGTQHKLIGDLLVAPAPRHEEEDLNLPRAKPVGEVRCGGGGRQGGVDPVGQL